MSYPYDPDTRDLVTRRLYELLPSLYRLEDQPPKGRAELEHLIRVLAAPLAILRQNIEELQADLFIDSANDRLIPRLAEMVSMSLVFPDADSNRRDVRSTVGFRRRKGTPSMLSELGETLTEQLVVMHEGWQLVQVTQDLNLLRSDRVTADLRPALIAEKAEGPLTDTYHTVDVRRIGLHTGKFHPRHVTHWVHPTLSFETKDASASHLHESSHPDLRYTFHPLGEYLPLRARKTGQADLALKTDRVPDLHFAADPGAWFDRPGRFSVKICGVAAAVGRAAETPRSVSRLAATAELLDQEVAFALLDHNPRRFQGPVLLQVVALPLGGMTPATPDTSAAQVRAEITIAAAGAGPSTVVNSGAVAGGTVVLLRLQPVGAPACFFPGATLEIRGGGHAASLGAHDAQLAREGYLRGALFIRLPATLVNGDRWLYLAADGSVYDAQSTGSGVVDVAIEDPGGDRRLDRDRLLAAGPGAAWPPLDAASNPDPLVRIPSAPGRGPVILHGGRVLQDQSGHLDPVPPATRCALIFAASHMDVVRQYRPFVRLEWQGPDPSDARWIAVGDDGLPQDGGGQPIQVDTRFQQLAEFRETGPNRMRLAVRFECQLTDAVMAPSEVSWTSYDGKTVLIYLPSFETGVGSPSPNWGTDASVFLGVSVAVNVAEDGSTWGENADINARRALGQVAPLREYTALRRRRVIYRSLCQWRNETAAGILHDATKAGRLDIDAGHGLFSMMLDEPPQAYAQGPEGPPVPASVTTVYQEGYAAHIGARGDAREPLLDERLLRPTRIVSAGGCLHAGAPADWHGIPRFRTLGSALKAISTNPAEREVVQFEDSATYVDENLVWPANCDYLTVQAAERERPVVSIADWASHPDASYQELILRGVLLGGKAAGALAFPRAMQVWIQFCALSHEANEMVFTLLPDGDRAWVSIDRSLTAGLRLNGPGRLKVADSVVDAGAGTQNQGIAAEQGEVRLERVTLFGKVRALVLYASEVIFNNDAEAVDRFQGCVRYSRVTASSSLPHVYRILKDGELVDGVTVRHTPVYVSTRRHHPAHARLSDRTDPAILRGAENGSEMGAFHNVRQGQRYGAFMSRLHEYTPAGLQSGIIRID